MKVDILVLRRYSEASNSEWKMEVRGNSNFSQTEPSQLH